MVSAKIKRNSSSFGQIDLDEVTIIVPTHNRKDFLLRLLDYYQPIHSSIIVTDSSNIALDRSDVPTNVRYQYFPNISFTEKMRRALNCADTKFVQIVADDDFVLLDALIEGVKFLEQNNDYGSVQGWHVGFQYNPPAKFEFLRFLDDDLFTVSGMHQFALDQQICSSEPIGRIKEGINPYMNKFYALHRREILESFFNRLCPKIESCRAINNLVLQEIAQAINSLYWGKHKTLQRPWIYREMQRYSLGSAVIEPLKDLRDSNNAIYEGFITSLTEHFAEKSPNTILKVHLKQLMNEFIDEYIPRWEAGEILHFCDPSVMIYEPEDIAKMNEIKNIVVRHKAQLEPNWIEMEFGKANFFTFDSFYFKVKNLANKLKTKLLNSGKGCLIDIHHQLYRLYFNSYHKFANIRKMIKNNIANRNDKSQSK